MFCDFSAKNITLFDVGLFIFHAYAYHPFKIRTKINQLHTIRMAKDIFAEYKR